MNSRLFAITYKEIIHIWRDKRALVVMLFIPVVELFLLGYAATTDIRHLNTAVYDATAARRAARSSPRIARPITLTLIISPLTKPTSAVGSTAAPCAQQC